MLGLLCALVLGCPSAAVGGERPTGTPPNILLITLDDVGIDRFPSYGGAPGSRSHAGDGATNRRRRDF